MPYYDQWGWASETEIPGRYTEVPLPENIPQGYAANWTGFAWRVVAYSPPTPPVSNTRMTKLAFRNRFTRNEKAGIELAAADNPAASLQERLTAAAVRADLADQRDATYIDTARKDTRDGTLALEAFGLIGEGRALVILDTPITEDEAYRA